VEARDDGRMIEVASGKTLLSARLRDNAVGWASTPGNDASRQGFDMAGDITRPREPDLVALRQDVLHNAAQLAQAEGLPQNKRV
jgi:hypothetical protein